MHAKYKYKLAIAMMTEPNQDQGGVFVYIFGILLFFGFLLQVTLLDLSYIYVSSVKCGQLGRTDGWVGAEPIRSFVCRQVSYRVMIEELESVWKEATTSSRRVVSRPSRGSHILDSHSNISKFRLGRAIATPVCHILRSVNSIVSVHTFWFCYGHGVGAKSRRDENGGKREK